MTAPYTHNHYISLKSGCACQYELRPDKYPYKSIKESKEDYLTYAPLEAYSVFRNIEKDFDYQKLALETSEAIKSYDVNAPIDMHQRLKYVSLTTLLTLIPRMEWLKGNVSVIKQYYNNYQKDVDNGAIDLIKNDKKALKVFLNQIYGKESFDQK